MIDFGTAPRRFGSYLLIDTCSLIAGLALFRSRTYPEITFLDPNAYQGLLVSDLFFDVVFAAIIGVAPIAAANVALVLSGVDRGRYGKSAVIALAGFLLRRRSRL